MSTTISSFKKIRGFISGQEVQGKEQVASLHFHQYTNFHRTETVSLDSFIHSLFSTLGDVMCLHQIGNHESVEFGEFGIDPVERDQVLTTIKLSKIITIL